jgi:hypothetical protein
VVDGHSRILVRSEQVSGAYAILEQEIPSGKGPPLHVHRHETEVFYVVLANSNSVSAATS